MVTRHRPAPVEKNEWDALEDALLQSGGTARTRQRASRELDRMFDQAEQNDLRRLAEHARLVRSRSPLLGNVVFLHGITGADLAVTDGKGDASGVWVNVMRIIAGRMEELRLDTDASREADPRLKVQATRVNQKYYAKAVLSLRARWNVEAYAYDWRRDIDEAADGLAALITRAFPGQPVHLVAHSMGGLVARSFILRHAELWEGMKHGELTAGGRLVMLGTPNYGSFSIPPVLTGSDQLMELLERLDLVHNMPELLAITNSFLGSYMLLPAPGKLPAPLSVLYQRDTWGDAPAISQRHLNRTYQFYKDLEQATTIDPTRMVYVAGCRHATIASMNIVAPGEFEYNLSYDGDGRVPHALGLLPGVPTYFVDEVHGDLARNEQVMRAVDELLETGATEELSTTLLRARAVAEPKMRDYRTAADRRLMEELERIANKARGPDGPASITLDEQRLAADALVKAALGTSARSVPKPLPSEADALARARRAASGIRPVDLEITARFGDVTKVKVPVIVVGHYRGIQPVNAIGAIDKALGGWIGRAVKRGMISGQLGETFFVPTHGALAADAIVVAGMGDYGQFGPTSLRRLMANVAVGAAALGLPAIGSVLVGSGEGALDRDTALRELLEGLGTGLAELREELDSRVVALTRIVLIEHDAQRFLALLDRVRALASHGGLTNVNLKLRPALPAEIKRARSAAARARGPAAATATATNTNEFAEVRITVERDEARGVLRFSALTKNAVVPVREVAVDLRNASEAAEALRKARTREEQERFGRLLYTYLVPEDFQQLIEGPLPVRLLVDSTTASFPWEMACFTGRGDGASLAWLGTDLGLSRQFKTLLSAAPGVTPVVNDKLRVLVIADPAPERALQLPGARTEGRQLVQLLKRASGQVIDGARIDLEVEQRIGAGECDPIEILALLLSGDFDIVHFSGHGDYDAQDPHASGWIFGRDRILSARDIFRARKVPRLVFANACFSGVLREGAGGAPPDLGRTLASIAEAFLERGVVNYIGAGWPVDDAQAVTMAKAFYQRLLARAEIGKALQEARQVVFAEQTESTWGAYQLYGNPGDTLVRRRRASDRAP